MVQPCYEDQCDDPMGYDEDETQQTEYTDDCMSCSEDSRTCLKACDSNGRVSLAATSVTVLNLIQVGNERWNRVGRQIWMTRVRLRGNSNNAQTRLFVVYDKAANGVAAVPSEIMQTFSQTGANSGDFTAFENLDNEDRFKILYDSWRVSTQTTTPGAITDSVPGTGWRIEEDISVNRSATYKADSTPAVVGDIATGALLLVHLSAGNAGSILYRVEYYDQ